MSTEVSWDNTKPIVIALDNFLAKVEEMYLNYMNRRFPNNKKETLTYTIGSRYIKVVRGYSVWCFIDKKNGNVLFPHSWKAPELKNPRGNLFSEQGGLEAVTTGGDYNIHPHIKYLR